MIFGVDVKNSRIKLMRTQSQVEKIVVEYLPFDDELALRGNIAEMFESALSNYVKEKGEFKSAPVTLVLPDNAVGIDAITLPTMKRSRLADVYATEFKTLYKNHTNLQSKSIVIKSSKMATTYLVTMIQKKMVSDIDDVLDKYNLNLKTTTFAAAATAEALMTLGYKFGKHNTMIVDIKKEETEISFYGKDIIFGFSDLPFGYDALKTDGVITDSMVYFNEVSELAVINAKESAKSKSLTMAIDVEEDEDEEISKVVSKDPEKSEKVKDKELSRDDFVKLMQEETKVNEVEEDDETLEEVKVVVAQKTLTRKVKRYPKYMQREEPTSEEEYIIENFRLFQKRILLYAKHCEFSDYLPDVDYVLVHLPEQFMFLNEKIVPENNKDLELRFFSTENVNNQVVSENLDLYGSKLGKHITKNSIY